MTPNTLFETLKAACAWEWERYIRHDFVRKLGLGTLPEPAFRHYLQQDYLFLLHFARAYALAGYKAETLADMRAAAATFSATAVRPKPAVARPKVMFCATVMCG